MIPCYELRIGNQVLVNGQPQRVASITAINITVQNEKAGPDQSPVLYPLNKIEAVPMSDEILKAYGFVFHDYFKFWQLVTTDIRSEMDISRDYDVIDFMRRPILKKMDSLHQLQNLYFLLKGRELVPVKMPVMAASI